MVVCWTDESTARLESVDNKTKGLLLNSLTFSSNYYETDVRPCDMAVTARAIKRGPMEQIYEQPC